MTHTTAEQALLQARQTQQSMQTRLYQQQVTAFQDQAAHAYQAIIRPWWQSFVQSEAGAQIGLLMSSADVMTRPRLYQPRISERVRYLRQDGLEWEAYLFLQGQPRALELTVQQLRNGRQPNSWASALAAHQHIRQIPVDEPELPTLDLHPVILVDFAEQISANVVAAHIQQHLLNQSG